MSENSIWSANGAPLTATMAREQLYLSTGGQTGIINPDSLLVEAQDTPDNTVRINPGSFAIAATPPRAAVGYTSAPWQSYGRSIYTPINVEIARTDSSGGRTDVVGIIIEDPDYEDYDLSPEELLEHEFWRVYVAENVGTAATRPEHFASLRRPFMPLAQVNMPASEQTVRPEYIEDIRFMALSRTHIVPLLQEVSETESQVIPASQTSWTTVASFEGIQQPQWATSVAIQMMLGPVYTLDDGANGQFRVLTNANDGSGNQVATAPTLFVETLSGASERFYMHASGYINLGSSAAGGTGNFYLQIRRTVPDRRTGRLVIPSNDTQTCRASGSLSYEEGPRKATG